MKPRRGDTSPIGGFHALAVADLASHPSSLWARLRRGTSGILDFASGRAALAWLLRTRAPRGARVWIPDYCCVEVARAIRWAGFRPRLYAVDEALAPDSRALGAALRSGDVALGVDYFGRRPDARFLTLVRARPDVMWIEDRAQALDCGALWAPWAIYSLRKVVGVSDGAALVATGAPLTLPGRSRARPSAAACLPELMRLEDPQGVGDSDWYAAYRRRERAIGNAPDGASRLSLLIAERLAFAPIRVARRANYAALRERLGGSALAPPPGRWVPFAYPLLVEDAAGAQRALARRRIYCARHWAELPRGAGAAARRLAAREISLPCDQRYGPADMARIVDALRAENLVPRIAREARA